MVLTDLKTKNPISSKEFAVKFNFLVGDLTFFLDDEHELFENLAAPDISFFIDFTSTLSVILVEQEEFNVYHVLKGTEPVHYRDVNEIMTSYWDMITKMEKEGKLDKTAKSDIAIIKKLFPTDFNQFMLKFMVNMGEAVFKLETPDNMRSFIEKDPIKRIFTLIPELTVVHWGEQPYWKGDTRLELKGRNHNFNLEDKKMKKELNRKVIQGESHLKPAMKDIQFQIDCLKKNRPDEMWDTLDIDNWEGLIDLLSNVQKKEKLLLDTINELLNTQREAQEDLLEKI